MCYSAEFFENKSNSKKTHAKTVGFFFFSETFFCLNKGFCRFSHFGSFSLYMGSGIKDVFKEDMPG